VKRFLDLISAEEAMQRLDGFSAERIETTDSRKAMGRVAASEIRSKEDIPHFFRSNMDGYAVRAEDTLGASHRTAVSLTVVGTVAMGEATDLRVTPGCAARISTGGMMPEGADAVVLVEHSEELPGGRVAIRENVRAGQSTVAIGEDMRAGDLVFVRGHRFRGSDVGVLTGIGQTTVEVFAVPRVGVIATGDEIVEPDAELPPGRVRNVNEYLLAALAARCGATVHDYGVIGDDPDVLARTLEVAVAENDVTFVSGGSSKGAKDLTRSAFEAIPGAEILFHGISIAPGKPTLLAKIGSKALMGVPGNPAAVAVVFTIFGEPLVRALGGEPLARILMLRPRVRARLATRIPATEGRDDFTRVRIEAGNGALPIAHAIRGKSVALSTVARADGLVRVPASSGGLAADAEVDVLLLD
jgi:molybdopterin molybdotransferase